MFLYRVRAVWPPLTLLSIAAVASLFAPLTVTVPLILFQVVMLFDAWARLREFDTARSLMQDGLAVGQLMRKHRHSWCQREMMKAAAASHMKAGDSLVSFLYRAQGYRWYHIFPDGTFSRDCPFLKRNFWQSLFGLPASNSLR